MPATLIIPLVLALAVELASLTVGGEYHLWRWCVGALYLLVLVPALVFAWRHRAKEAPAWTSTEIAAAVGCLTAWAALRAWQWDAAPLWLDEYTQFQGSYVFPHPSQLSPYQQQPPGSYIFIQVMGLILGADFAAVRLTGWLPAFGSAYLLLGWARRVGGWAAMLPLGAYLAWDSHILYHSLEGRSVGLGMLWAAYALNAGDLHLRRGDRGTLLAWAAGIFLTLMSTGLQGAVLPISMVGACLIVGFATRDRALLRLGLAGIAAGAAFAPVQLRNLWVASQQGYLANRPSSFDNAQFTWQVFVYNHRELGLKLAYAVAFLASIPVFWRAHTRPVRTRVAAFALALVLFPLIFTPLFFRFVQWFFQRRYIDLWWLAMSAAIFVAPFAWIRSARARAALGMCLAVTLTVAYWAPTPPHWKYRGQTGWRPDWQELYQELARPQWDGVHFYVNGECLPSDWCFSMFIGPEFKSTPTKLRPRLRAKRAITETPHFDDSGLLQDAHEHVHAGRWALVVPLQNSREFRTLDGKADARVRAAIYGDFLVITGLTPSESPRSLLEGAIALSPTTVIFYRLHETLVRLEIQAGHLASAREARDRWARLEGHAQALTQSATYAEKWAWINTAVAGAKQP